MKEMLRLTIQRSKNKFIKAEPLGLRSLSKDMDDIIGKMDRIRKPNAALARRKERLISERSSPGMKEMKESLVRLKEKINRKRSQSRSLSKKVVRRKKAKPLFGQKRNGPLKERSHSIQKKKLSPLLKDFPSKNQAIKLNRFKNFIQLKKREQIKRSVQKKSRKRFDDNKNMEGSELKISAELENIVKTINILEGENAKNDYKNSRKLKLKTMLRSNKLADLRNNMKVQKKSMKQSSENSSEVYSFNYEDSHFGYPYLGISNSSSHKTTHNWKKNPKDKLLNARARKSNSNSSLNKNLERNYTMRKCKKCTMYYPSETFGIHFQSCM